MRSHNTPDVCEDDTLDRTPWPVNRMSYQDLKVAELDAIEKLFALRDDTPLLMKWVMQRTQSGAFRKRLLVMSALRLWLARRKKQLRTTVESVEVYQLIHVTKIVVMRGSGVTSDPAPDSALAPSTCATTPIKIHFASSIAGRNGNEGGVELAMLHIDPGAHSESVVRLLQRQLHALRFAFPSGSLPPVQFPPRCNWQEYFGSNDTPGDSTRSRDEHGGMLDDDDGRLREQFEAISAAYRAFCDDLRAPYRESVMVRLQECVSSLSCIDFQYCLALPAGDTSHQHLSSQEAHLTRHDAHNQQDKGAMSRATATVLRCLGIGPPSVATLLRRETQALARALEYADCVENIVVRQLEVKNAGLAALFQSLLSPSSTVQGLALHDVRLSASALRILQNLVLQSTIKRERDSQTGGALESKPVFRRLDLSFNRFSQKMAVELAVTLELLPLGLELLHLERCALSEAACCLLLSSVGANAVFASALRELNLSGNHLGREGTKVLASWLTSAFALRQLDVSRTALDLNCFCLALQQNSILTESALVHLDISYNRMRSRASQVLGLVLGKTRSLATLVLRGMIRFHIAHITVGRKHSSFGESLTSIVRSRRVKRGIAISTSGTNSIQHTGGLKCEHLHNILSPMFGNVGRAAPVMVDLSENNLRGKKAELLAQLIDASPTIARHSLRLDHTCLHDKASLLLLHSIRGCATLNSLSLEGNGVVKRSTQRKRVVEPPRGSFRAEGDSIQVDRHPSASSLERAAARALSLLVGKASTASRGTGSPTSWAFGRNRTPPSLTPAQPSTPQLRELCLKSYSSFVFGSLAIAAVVDALAFTSSLRILDVAGNECGDALSFALGRALPLNSSLQTLFWDDNCTSVDGFFAFYAGLVSNRSLTTVQMPIQDTRRILEEQKDPPREKLFSVLAKIFKVTERNQKNAPLTCQYLHDENETDSPNGGFSENPRSTVCNQQGHDDTTHPHQLDLDVFEEKQAQWNPEKSNIDSPGSKCDEIKMHSPEDQRQPVERNNVLSTHCKSADPVQVQSPNIPRCPSPDVAALSKGNKTWRAADESTVDSSATYRLRYPSTMHSWDRRGARKSIGAPGLCDSIDFTAQWTELNALTASFSKP